MVYRDRYQALLLSGATLLGTALLAPGIVQAKDVVQAKDIVQVKDLSRDLPAEALSSLPTAPAAPGGLPQANPLLISPEPLPALSTKLSFVTPEVEAAKVSPSGKGAVVEQRIAQAIVPAPRLRNSLSQVTSVSQLSDVRPTDWAFQALQSLVERYGVIVGYPDKTYRGNQALSRYEFAAGLNAALDRISELIAAGTADLVKKEDLATLQRLQEEFAAELATLRGRVDSLEARTTKLEKQQFSTTTKLTGEAVFALTSAFQGSPNGSVPVFQDRVRLFLDSSFSGKDLLNIRLATGNGTRLTFPGSPNNAQGSQIINLPAGANNQVFVDWVAYTFPVGENLTVYVPAYGGRWWDFAPTLNPVLGDGTSGKKALGLFGLFNPIYAIGGGSGLGLNYQLGKSLAVSVGYLAGDDTASIPSGENALFNGQYSALAQVTWNPTPGSGIALTYVNAYLPNGPIFDYGTGGAKVGSAFANRPFIGASSSDSYGISGFLRLSPQFVVNGFAGYTNANNLRGSGDAEIWYYGLGLAFPDLGKKGNLGGIVVGAEPYRGDAVINDVSLHLEAFYKYQVNDYISITPGVIWITSPNQNSNNQDAIIGTIRTTFAF